MEPLPWNRVEIEGGVMCQLLWSGYNESGVFHSQEHKNRALDAKTCQNCLFDFGAAAFRD